MKATGQLIVAADSGNSREYLPVLMEVSIDVAFEKRNFGELLRLEDSMA